MQEEMIHNFESNEEYPIYNVFNFNGLNKPFTVPYNNGDFVIMNDYCHSSIKGSPYTNIGHFIYEGFTRIKICQDVMCSDVIFEYQNKNYKKCVIALENGNKGDIIKCLIKIIE